MEKVLSAEACLGKGRAGLSDFLGWGKSGIGRFVQNNREHSRCHALSMIQEDVFESARVAKLRLGHKADGEALPQIFLDPERKLHGTVYLVRERSVVRAKIGWIERMEKLGAEAMGSRVSARVGSRGQG